MTTPAKYEGTPSKYEGTPSKYVGVSEKRSPRRQKTAARPPVFGGRDDMMKDDMLKGKPPLRRKQPWDVKEA